MELYSISIELAKELFGLKADASAKNLINKSSESFKIGRKCYYNLTLIEIKSRFETLACRTAGKPCDGIPSWHYGIDSTESLAKWLRAHCDCVSCDGNIRYKYTTTDTSAYASNGKVYVNRNGIVVGYYDNNPLDGVIDGNIEIIEAKSINEIKKEKTTVEVKTSELANPVNEIGYLTKLNGLISFSQLKIGMHVMGEVVRIESYAAWVDIGIGKNGYLHISQVCEGYTEDINEKLHIGDQVEVTIVDIDEANLQYNVSARSDAVEFYEFRKSRGLSGVMTHSRINSVEDGVRISNPEPGVITGEPITETKSEIKVPVTESKSSNFDWTVIENMIKMVGKGSIDPEITIDGITYQLHLEFNKK